MNLLLHHRPPISTPRVCRGPKMRPGWQCRRPQLSLQILPIPSPELWHWNFLEFLERRRLCSRSLILFNLLQQHYMTKPLHYQLVLFKHEIICLSVNGFKQIIKHHWNKYSSKIIITTCSVKFFWKNNKITFSNATIKKDTPGKPHGTREVERVLLCILALSEFEPPERTETIQQVQNQSHHVNRQTDENPQSFFERLKERRKTELLPILLVRQN